jgi:hypothetical protein
METFECLTIYTNSSLAEDTIKKIDPVYVIDKKYPLNKTVVYKDTYVFPLNIFLKDAVVVMTERIAPVFGEIIPPLMNYLTSTIKTMCTVDVANEVGFRLTIYTPQTMTMNDNPYFTKYTNTKTVGILGEQFPNNMSRYAIPFKFTSDWVIIQTKIVEEGVLVGPCFPPVTSAPKTTTPWNFGQSAPTPAPTSWAPIAFAPQPTPSQPNAPNQARAQTNIFGTPQNQNQTPVFQTQTQPSIFGTPQTQTQPPPLFGTPQTQPLFATPQAQIQPLFTTPQTQQGIFGTPQSQIQPLFGTPHSFGFFGAQK